ASCPPTSSCAPTTRSDTCWCADGRSGGPRRARRARSGSIDRPLLRALLGGEAELRVDGSPVRDAGGHVLADGGPVLEAVPGAAPHQPDVVDAGMAADQAIYVRAGVLVAQRAGVVRVVVERWEAA